MKFTSKAATESRGLVCVTDNKPHNKMTAGATQRKIKQALCLCRETQGSSHSSNIVLSVSVLTASVDGIDQSVGVFAADTVNELSVRPLP